MPYPSATLPELSFVLSASVLCEEDLITFGSTTPAPATETTTDSVPQSSTAVPTSAARPNYTAESSSTTEGRVCTPVVVTAPPADEDTHEARPVQPTNYISEYVRLRVGELS